MESKIRVGIAGAAGYTGGELIRILLNHPKAEISFALSKSQAGSAVYDVHRDLVGETELHFTNELSNDIDVLFLCMGHGESGKFLKENDVASSVKIIDLSNDFRLKGQSEGFVYGLPELNLEAITKANKIANPGCFATAIQLALLPLAKEKQLKKSIHITGVTGSTGAGQGLSRTSHFSWRSGNLSAYKAFEHQHEGEIKQSLTQLQKDFNAPFHFVPVRGDFPRGIMVTIHLESGLNEAEATALYKNYYKDHPFVHISKDNPDLKQVVNTNKSLIFIEKHGDQLHIVSLIDNLLKGASGQAVQNMNLMFGLEQSEGLKLKAVAY